jgi:hypothetical protein
MKVCVIGLKNKNYPTEIFHSLFNFLQSELPLKNDVRVVLTDTRQGEMTTGVRENNEIRVLAKNRMLIDIFRTIIHEWVHEFQHQKLGLPEDLETPEIGGPTENMASVLASVFLKKFQKKYPKYKPKIYQER